MKLTDLPPEIFRAILEALAMGGIDNAMAARLVCKMFSDEIIRAICSARALEALNYNGYSERLLSEYLLARTLADHGREHHSCAVIRDTVDHILEERPQDRPQKIEYMRALSLATVESCHSGITDVLNPGTRKYKAHKPTAVLPRRKCSLFENALAATAYLGIAPLFHRLLQDGTEDALTYFGRPFSCAARRGDLEMTRLLLEKGFTVMKRIERWPIINPRCALGQTAQNNYGAIIRMMFEEKNYAQSTRNPAYTYLDWIQCATSVGHLDTVRYLVQRATSEGHLDAVGSNGVSIYHVTPGGKGAYQSYIILYAAFHGREEVARAALEDGASPNSTFKHNLRNWAYPLCAAAKHGHEGVVLLLIASGARVCKTYMSAPLAHAARGGWLRIAQILIDNGAEVNPVHKRTWDEIPLMSAVMRNQVDMVRLLLENGADLKANPLAYAHAASQGYTSIMRILIEYGAEPQTHLAQ